MSERRGPLPSEGLIESSFRNSVYHEPSAEETADIIRVAAETRRRVVMLDDEYAYLAIRDFPHSQLVVTRLDGDEIVQLQGILEEALVRMRSQTERDRIAAVKYKAADAKMRADFVALQQETIQP